MINRGFIDEVDCPALNYQRMTKPLIEKRRRARINGCLGQLKEMVIDSGRHNMQNPKCKYEKADILEITVDYLKDLHLRQQLDNNQSAQSYSAGFEQCIKYVEHFMKCIPLSEQFHQNNGQTLDHNLLSEKLLTHLEYCRHELTHNDNNNAQSLDRPVTGLDIDNRDIHQLNNGYSERNLMSPNSFSVIHHTRDYSSSVSSLSSASSTKTMYSPPSSPESTHRELTSRSRPSQSEDFIPEIRDMRANSLGLYENEKNGQCYHMDADGVWRPW